MSLYDKASLVQIPSGTKDGTLYSVLPANGDGDFTHTRASSATRVNKDGLIESVASGVPRLDYPLIDGVVQNCPALLLEPSRANKAQRTEEFDNSYWAKLNTTITANQIVSPDGSQTADKYTHGGSSAVNYIYGDIGLVTSGNDYTFSVFVKKGTGTFVQIFFGSGAFGVMHQNFDIENGVIGSSSGNATPFIQEFPNGWYRIGITDDCTTTQTAGTAFVSLAQSNTASRLNTFTSSDDFYIWGAQLELGDYPTSYIPTTTASVTRSADECNSAGTSAEFNDSEGVLFVETSKLSTSDNGGVTISNGSYTYRVVLYFDNSGNVRGQVYSSGEQASIVTSGLDYTNNNKLALKYSATSTKFFVNGFQIGSTDTSSTMPIGLSELAFDDGGGGSDFYGNTKQLMTFNEALTDSELEQITSWTSFGEMAKGQLYTIE